MTFYDMRCYTFLLMSRRSTVASIQSVALSGFIGDSIDVETDMHAGLP